MNDIDCVIVGGGMAGLVAARHLAAAGFSVTLLEASESLGGKVAAHVVDGLVLDAGAESFATRGDLVADYVRVLGLGLGDDIVAPNGAGAWLYPVSGEPAPLPRAGVLGIPANPLAADVVHVLGLWGALRARLDSVLPRSYGAADSTLSGVVRKRMGRRALQRLVAPIAVGIHSRPPEALSFDTVAPGLRAAMLREGSLAGAVRQLRAAATAGTAVAGIRGGIARLTAALETDLERLGVVVRIGAPVRKVEAGAVTLADGTRLTARHVVLAAPDVELTARSTPPAAVQQTIVLATLVLECSALDEAPRGTGLLVAPGVDAVKAKALTHATAKWSWLAEVAGEHRHVVRLSYDASRLLEAELLDANVPGSGLQGTALRDAATLLGVRLEERDVQGFSRVEWAPTQPDPRPAPEGVTVIGESVAGTGLAAVIRHSLTQAALVADHLGAEPR